MDKLILDGSPILTTYTVYCHLTSNQKEYSNLVWRIATANESGALSTAKQSSAVLGKAQHQWRSQAKAMFAFVFFSQHVSAVPCTFFNPGCFKIKVFPVSFGANNLKCVIVPSCADSKCTENTRDFWTHKHNLSSPLGSLARFGSLQFCVLPKNQMWKDFWFNRMGGL